MDGSVFGASWKCHGSVMEGSVVEMSWKCHGNAMEADAPWDQRLVATLAPRHRQAADAHRSHAHLDAQLAALRTCTRIHTACRLDCAVTRPSARSTPGRMHASPSARGQHPRWTL